MFGLDVLHVSTSHRHRQCDVKHLSFFAVGAAVRASKNAVARFLASTHMAFNFLAFAWLPRFPNDGKWLIESLSMNFAFDVNLRSVMRLQSFSLVPNAPYLPRRNHPFRSRIISFYNHSSRLSRRFFWIKGKLCLSNFDIFTHKKVYGADKFANLTRRSCCQLPYLAMWRLRSAIFDEHLLLATSIRKRRFSMLYFFQELSSLEKVRRYAVTLLFGVTVPTCRLWIRCPFFNCLTSMRHVQCKS